MMSMCDTCDKQIIGKRYKATHALDYDLCSDCFANVKNGVYFEIDNNSEKVGLEYVSV